MQGDKDRLVIRYIDRYSDDFDKYQYIDLDIIEDVNINLSSVVTTYPLIEGDSISDHMYREPGEISISGKFSENGRFAKSLGSNYTGRLKYIQNLFETIKDRQLFVDILSLYNVRENYVLSNINWKEHANSLDYTFTFNQVYLAKSNEIDYVVDVRDENLPDLAEPVSLDFTDNFIKPGELEKHVIMALQDLKIVDTEFLKGLGGSAALLGASAAVTGIIIGIAAATSTIPGVGWVVSAGLLLGLGVTKLVKTVKGASSKYKIKKFKTYRNKKKTEAEYKRFVKFMEEMHEEIQILEQSTAVYTVANNVAQETILNINGQYYSFVFTRNNSDNTWSLKISDLSDNVIRTVNKLTGLSSLDECISSNNLFSKVDGSQVFIFNKKLVEKDASEKQRDDNSDYFDLTNFMILVTDLDLSQWSNLVIDIIKNAVII